MDQYIKMHKKENISLITKIREVKYYITFNEFKKKYLIKLNILLYLIYQK